MESLSLTDIGTRVISCTLCELHKGRTKAVPGKGSIRAQVMMIGEAPGEAEDKAGEPFVGRAGKLLDKVIALIGLSREEVYITNLVKCRPSNNRAPTETEIASCSQYLLAEISLVKPRVVVTLGKYPTAYLLSQTGIKFKKLSEVRGKLREIQVGQVKFNIYPMFHPAAALYNPRLRSALEREARELGHIVRNLSTYGTPPK